MPAIGVESFRFWTSYQGTPGWVKTRPGYGYAGQGCLEGNFERHDLD